MTGASAEEKAAAEPVGGSGQTALEGEMPRRPAEAGLPADA